MKEVGSVRRGETAGEEATEASLWLLGEGAGSQPRSSGPWSVDV